MIAVKRIILLTIALVAAGVSIPQDAFACSCANPSLARRFDISDNVFTAIITFESVESIDQHRVVRSLFTVTQSFKGTRPFSALFSVPNGICDIDIDVGVEYLIYAPDSGSIGGCSGIRATQMPDRELDALRAFTSGKSPDLSDPWYFASLADTCRLHVEFEIGEPHFIEGVLQFRHPKRVDFPENLTELKIQVQLYDIIAPDGAHNPLRVSLGDESYFLPWSAKGAREQVLADGTTRMYSRAEDFVLRGPDVTEILTRLESVDFVSVSFQSSGFGPNYNARLGTTNLGSSAAEMRSCVLLN